MGSEMTVTMLLLRGGATTQLLQKPADSLETSPFREHIHIESALVVIGHYLHGLCNEINCTPSVRPSAPDGRLCR